MYTHEHILVYMHTFTCFQAVETDDIEYLRMSDDRRLVGENRLPLPGFEPVVYEDIDHTIPATPPPPPPRRNQ